MKYNSGGYLYQKEPSKFSG